MSFFSRRLLLSRSFGFSSLLGSFGFSSFFSSAAGGACCFFSASLFLANAMQRAIISAAASESFLAFAADSELLSDLSGLSGLASALSDALADALGLAASAAGFEESLEECFEESFEDSFEDSFTGSFEDALGLAASAGGFGSSAFFLSLGFSAAAVFNSAFQEDLSSGTTGV